MSSDEGEAEFGDDDDITSSSGIDAREGEDDGSTSVKKLIEIRVPGTASGNRRKDDTFDEEVKGTAAAEEEEED